MMNYEYRKLLIINNFRKSKTEIISIQIIMSNANNELKDEFLTRIIANFTNYTNFFKQLIKILNKFKIKWQSHKEKFV
jgi:hypothetical protein